MRRVTVDMNGEKCEGEEVGWKVLRGEEWSEYECDDGTVLKMKTIVGRVVRLDKRKPDGEPIYWIGSGNHVVAHVQPHMMERN